MIDLANIHKEMNPEDIRAIAISSNMYESERYFIFKIPKYLRIYNIRYSENYIVKDIPQYFEYSFKDEKAEYLLSRGKINPIELLGVIKKSAVKIYYIFGEFDALYYSETSDKFYTINQKIIFPCAILYDSDLDKASLNESCAKTAQSLINIRNTNCRDFIRDFLKFNWSDPVKDRMSKIIRSSKSVLEGKSLKEFNCCLNSPSKMPFKYGLEEYFLDIDVEFESDCKNSSKYFDWINVGGYVYHYKKYEFVKANKNKILKMYLDAIRSTAKWKSFNIPVNVLKVDSLMLDKGGYLTAKFSLKEASQS